MITMQIQVKVFLLVVLFLRRSECKGIGMTSTTGYQGCGVKLDFEIVGTIKGGTEVEENNYPWMVFLFNYDREEIGMDVMDLDLPEACKPNTITP